MKIYRYSGVRLDMGSHLYQSQLHVITQQAISMGKDIFQEALQAPYFFTDIDKKLSPEVCIIAVLMAGELFLLEKDNKIIAYAAFRNVTPYIKASLELYLTPLHRKTLVLGNFRAILEKAAFAPYPEGLQLLKLIAAPHVANAPSLKACAKSGFIALADLPFEGIYLGQVATMRHMELYPKEVRSLLKSQEIPNASSFSTKRNSDSTDSTRLRDSGVLQLPELQPLPESVERSESLPVSELPVSLHSGEQRPKRRQRSRSTTEHLPESSNSA